MFIVHKRKCKQKFKITLCMLLLVLPIIYAFCVEINKNQEGIFYVLMWTSRTVEPFIYINSGYQTLISMNCKYQNCYFTDNRTHFPDPRHFDVILFNAPNLIPKTDLPSKRSDNQIYVFVSTESASNYPMPKKFDYFFNYTWSYKLDSDIPYHYFVVKNKRTGKVIAPKTSVHWKIHEKMKLTPKSVVVQLQNKSIIAAWFVSYCAPERINYVRVLRTELQKLGQQIDIFGRCDANKSCPRKNMDKCFELLKKNYFFYLAFENSFSEDYVTEKLITAVNNYAVPVVYGGANYSRFLPDGAYLNARLHTPQNLAIRLNDIIKNRQDYYDYFRFYRYYTYYEIHESEDIHPLCAFCKFINNRSIWEQRRTYAQFGTWWNGKINN